MHRFPYCINSLQKYVFCIHLEVNVLKPQASKQGWKSVAEKINRLNKLEVAAVCLKE